MEHPFNKKNQSAALPNSLWANTAVQTPKTTPLSERKKADVVVIGAGFTGLSAALHLAEHNVSVVCLEASEIGWGASGRNNGQVIPGLKHDPEKIKKMLPFEEAEKLIKSSGSAPDLVFSLIKKHNIHCDAIQKGWIQPAPSSSSQREIESRCQQWQGYGAPVDMLETTKLEKQLGTRWYQSAWIDYRGGSLNPLSYARGLAQAALDIGVHIHTGSPVTHIRKDGDVWHVSTPQGGVTANMLLLCTNAYTGKLHSSLRRSTVPIRTAQIASAPLQEEDWKIILPNGEAASDASKLLTSFRVTPDKRLIMGGAYATGGNETSRLFSRLQKASQNRFPYLEEIKWEYHWSGYLAVTKTHLPQIFQLDDHCFAATGCNGRGIAMSTVTGKALAELIISEDATQCPIHITPASPFFFHQFRHLGISTNVALCGLQDKFRL